MKEIKISDVDMRDAFFDELYNIAKNDSQVILLTADMGAHSLVRFKKELKKQYINVGIAEQNMVSVAAGLSLGGKNVFIYTIVPFVTLRCYEQIKIDLCCMNLPVTIIGVGVGLTYGSDGPTHHGTQDVAVMRALPEITILSPSDSVLTSACARIAYKNTGPTYVRIDKGKLPLIYASVLGRRSRRGNEDLSELSRRGTSEENKDFLDGLAKLKDGSDLTIVSTGIMVHQALKVAEKLADHNISAGVVDLYRIKPINTELLVKFAGESKYIITIEENTVIGGIGSAVIEVLNDNGKNIPVKRISIPDEHCFKTGTREELHTFYNLDTESIVKIILKWIGGSYGVRD